MKRGSIQKLKELNEAKVRLVAEYREKVQEVRKGLENGGDLPSDPSDAFYQEIGARIRAVRKATGLTQEITSVFVGCTRASIANIEIGKQHPRLVTLVRFGELFGCDYREFLPKGNLKKRKGGR